MFVTEVRVTDGPISTSTEAKRADGSNSTDVNHLCSTKNASSTPTANTKNGVMSLNKAFSTK